MSGSALHFLSLRCVSNEKYTSGRPFAFLENITEHQETPTKNDANWANATCLGAVINSHFHFLPVTRDCGKAGWQKLCYYAPKKSGGCWVPAWLPVWFLAIFSPKSFKTVDIRWCFLRFFHTWISGIAFQDHSWADSSFLKLVSCMNVGREC